MTLNGNKIKLPKSFTIKFRDKLKNEMSCQKRALALPYYVKARIYIFTLATNCIQLYSRNSIRHADILPE